MANDERPEGERFSLLYLERGEPAQDSLRMRKRLASYFYSNSSEDMRDHVAKAIHQELGVSVINRGYGYLFNKFLEKTELGDILDTVTIIWKVLSEKRSISNAHEWRIFVSRVFKEETLRYSVDDSGGVHFFVDQEFSRLNVHNCGFGQSEI